MRAENSCRQYIRQVRAFFILFVNTVMTRPLIGFLLERTKVNLPLDIKVIYTTHMYAQTAI